MFDYNFVGSNIADVKVENGRLIITKKTEDQADETIEYDLTDVNLESYELQGKILKLKLDDGNSIDVDLSKFIDNTDLQNALNTKADANHNHDNRYYKKDETDNLLSNKADTNHNHDNRYYQKSEVNNIANSKADINHNHDDRYRKLSDNVNLSEVNIDANKDWNDKEIINVKRIYKRKNNGVGFELVENELRLYDKNNNYVSLNKYDNEDKTEIFTKDAQGNKLSGTITLDRNKITLDDKNIMLIKGKSVYRALDQKLTRVNLDLFHDTSLHMNITSKYVYIGATNSWGEIAKLPYRFALPINDNNELKGINLQNIFTEDFHYEETELDTILDDGNGGKKKYKTIRFKPAITDRYEIRLDMSFMLKNVDDNDWIGVGIDDHDPNGTGGHAFRTGALQIKKNKFTQGSNITVQINGSNIAELRSDKWYYISVQSLSRGYFQNAMLSIKKHYDGSEG